MVICTVLLIATKLFWFERIFVCFELQCVYGFASKEELNIWAYMASFGSWWETGNKLRIAATSPDSLAGWGVGG